MKFSTLPLGCALVSSVVLLVGCSATTHPPGNAIARTVNHSDANSTIKIGSLKEAAQLSDAAVVASPVSFRGELIGSVVTGEPLFEQKVDYWRMRVDKNIAGGMQKGTEFLLQVRSGEQAPKATYVLTAEPHGGTPAIFEGLPVYGLLPGVVPMTGEGQLRSAILGDSKKIEEDEAEVILKKSVGEAQRSPSAEGATR